MEVICYDSYSTLLSNLFIATTEPAIAYSPLFTYLAASPMDLMAAAAQMHADRQTQKNHLPT